MTKIQKYQAKDSGWTIDSVIKQNINVSRYRVILIAKRNKSLKKRLN